MTALPLPAPAYATPVDAARHGEYRPATARGHRFTTRLDGRTGTPADAGRYHLYVGASDPASHRLLILRALAGLRAAVSVSYVHGLRDARGWAFRESTGPDPVNGFTTLREAYLATDPEHRDEVTVPVLWDRRAARIVSSEPVGIGIDLLTTFPQRPAASALYPQRFAEDIERLDAWARERLGRAVTRGVYRREDAGTVRAALRRLDALLARSPRLVGDGLTDADVRVWVRLVRLDAGPNAHGAIGPRLDSYENLWRWARELYALPAFRDTTDFGAFTAPLADTPSWNS